MIRMPFGIDEYGVAVASAFCHIHSPGHRWRPEGIRPWLPPIRRTPRTDRLCQCVQRLPPYERSVKTSQLNSSTEWFWIFPSTFPHTPTESPTACTQPARSPQDRRKRRIHSTSKPNDPGVRIMTDGWMDGWMMESVRDSFRSLRLRASGLVEFETCPVVSSPFISPALLHCHPGTLAWFIDLCALRWSIDLAGWPVGWIKTRPAAALQCNAFVRDRFGRPGTVCGR